MEGTEFVKKERSRPIPPVGLPIFPDVVLQLHLLDKSRNLVLNLSQKDRLTLSGKPRCYGVEEFSKCKRRVKQSKVRHVAWLVAVHPVRKLGGRVSLSIRGKIAARLLFLWITRRPIADCPTLDLVRN